MDLIKVIKGPDKNNPYAVVYKPKELPSAPLSSDDMYNAFSQAAELFPQLLTVSGKKEIEHGLLHRLDTATDGLILIAATQDFYDYMISQQEKGCFIKYYTATCRLDFENPKLLENFPSFPYKDFLQAEISAFLKSSENILNLSDFKLESFFRPFGKGGKEVRPVTKDSGMAALKKTGKLKAYETQIISMEKTDDTENVIVNCKISQGFRHQVRCHLAWAGLPILNDRLYNFAFRNSSGSEKGFEKLCFSARKIEFFNPLEKQLKTFSCD